MAAPACRGGRVLGLLVRAGLPLLLPAASAIGARLTALFLADLTIVELGLLDLDGLRFVVKERVLVLQLPAVEVVRGEAPDLLHLGLRGELGALLLAEVKP